jgi:sulfatase maturation enzyme AslB (radical SAM superfamily)
MGVDKFKIGDIHRGIDSLRQSYFVDLDLNLSSRCQRCWARYICRPCPYGNFLAGDIKRIPGNICKLHKSVIEHAIVLTTRLHRNNIDFHRVLREINHD